MVDPNARDAQGEVVSDKTRLARMAKLEAENARLVYERDVWKSKSDMHSRQATEARASAEALSRTGAVKVPAEASKEMIEDGVLAYNLTGIAGGVINTAEDHVTFIWNAMAAHLSALEPAAPEGQQEAGADAVRFLYKHGALTHVAAREAVELLTSNGFEISRRSK